jgi:hypothetical protein
MLTRGGSFLPVVIPRSQRAPCELISHRVQLGACAQKDSPTASHGTGCRERGRMRRSTEYGSFAGAHGYGYPIAQLPSAELHICHVHSFNQRQSEAAECAEVPHLAATRAFKLRTCTIHAAKRAVLDSRGAASLAFAHALSGFVLRPIRKYPAIVTW